MSAPPSQQYLDMLRATGVHSFHFNDPANDYEWDVSFFPTPASQQVDLEAAAEQACKCGHAVMEHNAQGECLRGCAVETCEPKQVS